MSGLTVVALFVISLFFSLFIYSLWLRIALRYFRISFLNPLSQLIHTVTDPLVNPVQSLLKTKKPGQKYDIAAFVVLVVVEVIKINIISLLAFQAIMPFWYFLAYVLADLIIQPCDLLFYAILIRLILSFTNPAWRSPIADFLYILTEPFLKFSRKIIPVIAGFDFSPMFMLMLLKVVTLFINANLPWRLL